MNTTRNAAGFAQSRKCAMQIRLFLTMLTLVWIGLQPASAQLTPAGECLPALVRGDATSRPDNAMSDCYVMNQTFDRRAFRKDNNIWTVTKGFAETFGMPMEWIDPALNGIEAAAFRIEDGFRLCGMGGKAEQCMKSERCMLDIYVDERKHPLPWATDQKADWHERFSSLHWLRTPTEKEGARMPDAPGFIPNRVFRGFSSLRPFADPDSKKEAIFLSNASSPNEGDLTFNAMPVFGFHRQSISKLSLISLSLRCTVPTESRKQIVYRLEVRDEIFSPMLRRFLEFKLSEKFTQQLRDVLKAQQELDSQYYRSLFNVKPAAPLK